MKKITHAQFKEILHLCYSQTDASGRKLPILVKGTFGIGKSAVIRDVAMKLAKQSGRKFAEWNKLTREQKDTLYKNPSAYFLLIDIRLSEMDVGDTKGLPDYKDKDSVEWKLPFWAKFLENPDSAGILFFDELNLAFPSVMSSIYKIVHDRVVSESKISDNWLIVSAGNNDDDKAHTHDIAEPLRDRCVEVELIPPTIKQWSEWAMKKGFDSRIIGYLNWKPSSLHHVNFEDGQKQTTPRGWERLNILINGLTDLKLMELICESSIGEGIAKEFIGFCKLQETVNLDDIIENPKLVREITDAGIKYFVVSGLAERYQHEKMTFKQMVKVSEAFDEEKNVEFVMLLWMLCSRYVPKRFEKDFTSIENASRAITVKYAKYIFG